jgi:GNAT superfamily N-acetyltransferase
VPASTADAPEVVALIGRVFAEYGFIYEPETEVADLFAWDRHYGAPGGAFYVVRSRGTVVGSVGVNLVAADAAEVHRLYLDAELRGRGLGRRLVERVLDWCRERGIGHLVLWSDTRFDLAHRLYERMGFARTGERDVPGDINQSREFRYERAV